MRIVQCMVGCGRAQGIQWRLNYIHSMKYAEVINTSIAANSAGIDYSALPILFCKHPTLYCNAHAQSTYLHEMCIEAKRADISG